MKLKGYGIKADGDVENWKSVRGVKEAACWTQVIKGELSA
jgi:hypothetical protein